MLRRITIAPKKEKKIDMKKLRGIAYLIGAFVPWYVLMAVTHHLKEVGLYLAFLAFCAVTVSLAVLGFNALSGK